MKLNNGLHGDTSVADAQELWSRCLGILRKLFLPPEMRHAELEALARVGSPSTADAEAVRKLVATPKHLQHFLTKVTAPAWLAVLSKAGILDPPENQQSPWPALAAVPRLAPDYPDELAAWLKESYGVHGAKRKPVAAWCIANAALEVGGPALGVVLSAATDHPKDFNILFLADLAQEKLDPSDEMVESIADVLLNPPKLMLGYHNNC